MKPSRLLGLSFLAALGGMILAACGRDCAKPADKSEILAANDAFYAALNALFTGDAAPIKDVWSHSDDITYMGPQGGLDTGWQAIGKMWDDVAAARLGGKVAPVDVHVNAGWKLAVVVNVEVGENTNANGKTAQVSIRATNVYRKEGGAWKMIGHHTDLLPYMTE
jgi:ketosteroid isomerase-like protein